MMVRAAPRDPSGVSGDTPTPAVNPGPPVDPGPPENPLANNEPREAKAEELPQEKVKAGWQVKPEPLPVPKFKCNHMGRIVASMTLWQFPVGAEWVCSCGQVFVVEENAGGKKVLRMSDKVVEVELPAGADDQIVTPPTVIEEPPEAEEWPVDEAREAEEPING